MCFDADSSPPILVIRGTAASHEERVVIFPDVRGLYRFYEELALRTAGASKRGEDFEYWPHVEQTTTETVQADVASAIAYLRGHGAAEDNADDAWARTRAFIAAKS